MTPAHAAGSLQDNGDGSFTASNLSSSERVFICDTTVAASVCGVGVNNYRYSASQSGTYRGGSTVNVSGSGSGPLEAGTYNVAIVVITPSAALVATASNVTIGAGGGGSSSDSSAPPDASVPAPVIQQFGKPASGTCDSAAPTTLNWAGVASGGWGESWAQWMNNGNGGAVCSRTLVYSNNLGMWTVG